MIKCFYHNLDDDVSLRVAQDLLKRGAIGPYIYMFFWPLIGVSTGFSETHPNVFYIVTFLMVLLTLLRILHGKILSLCYPKKFKIWSVILELSPIPQAFLMGLMFAFSLLIENHLLSVVMSFSTAGLVGGGTVSFAPSRLMSYGFLFFFNISPLVVAAIIPGQAILAFLIFSFLCFALVWSRDQQLSYWQSLNNELILSKQVRTDVLTQLDNRRYFDEKLIEFCNLSSRNSEPLAVLIIDCDFFKVINDTHGHDIGDECLKHLANIVKRAIPRKTDVCARYGGEEFCVLLPGSEIEGAKVVCERIRQSVELSPLTVRGVTINMTVSIGCVCCNVDRFYQELPLELFKQADTALYRAKQSGRNQSIISVHDRRNQNHT